MSMIFLLTAAAMAACTVVPCKHALHMFQQNRYELTRYTAWSRESLKGAWNRNVKTAVILAALLAAALILKGRPLLYEFLILAAALALGISQILRERTKTYIKPLVMTDRVKRQTGVLAVLLAAAIFYFLSRGTSLACWTALALTLGGPWILIYPMSLITDPMEHMVRNHYLNEAKAILQKHTGLVTIGITGSYGKTSTKNVMQSILSEQFNTLMTPASYNTPMGITRTIRENLKPIHQVFVCEMGADKVGDITELMNFVHPSIGVVTSIGPQHLGTFGSQENITREKMQMIELLPADGLGILNYDNDLIRGWKVQNPVRCVTYGIEHSDVDYHAEHLSYGAGGSSFVLVHGEERIPFQTRLLGKLNILNILSAIAAARYLKVSWPVIQRAVKEMKQVEHRLEQKWINGFSFIDDAFNANPSGARMALEVLSGMPGRRWIVTPGMIDLGERQAEINSAFGSEIKGRADEVILVGASQTKPIHEGLAASGFDMEQVHVMDTVREAFAYLYMHASREDTILLENDLPDAFNK